MSGRVLRKSAIGGKPIIWSGDSGFSTTKLGRPGIWRLSEIANPEFANGDSKSATKGAGDVYILHLYYRWAIQRLRRERRAAVPLAKLRPGVIDVKRITFDTQRFPMC